MYYVYSTWGLPTRYIEENELSQNMRTKLDQPEKRTIAAAAAAVVP